MADLFNLGIEDGFDFLSDKKERKNDGILRIDPKKASDPAVGVKIRVRFLPNFTREKKVEDSALEKIVNYVKIDSHPELTGYYDSLKNFGKKCPLYTLFFDLYNSTDFLQKENSKCIKKSQKYYSYVQILEHETEPDLVGKIMVFPFGVKIKEKITEERTGALTGDKVNVYDLANGKDFIIRAKMVGGFVNYDSSSFSPKITAVQILNGEGVLKHVPVTVDEETGKNAIASKHQAMIVDYLLSRDCDIEQNAAVDWTSEVYDKVNKIEAILKNKHIQVANSAVASRSADNGSFFDEEEKATPAVSSAKSTDDEDDFFN